MDTNPINSEGNKPLASKAKKYKFFWVAAILSILVSFAPVEIPGTRISKSYGCGNEKIGATCSKTTFKSEPLLFKVVKDLLGTDPKYDNTKNTKHGVDF